MDKVAIGLQTIVGGIVGEGVSVGAGVDVFDGNLVLVLVIVGLV
jgi:hypothetical protein